MTLHQLEWTAGQLLVPAAREDTGQELLPEVKNRNELGVAANPAGIDPRKAGLGRMGRG